MIFAGAVMVGPVAAVDAKSPITGNISSYIALTVTGTGISSWPLALGPTPNVNTSDVTLLLVCNYPGWTISALDAMDTAGAAEACGIRGKNGGIFRWQLCITELLSGNPHEYSRHD